MRYPILAAACALLLVTGCGEEHLRVDDERRAASRAIAAEYGARLKGELVKALNDGTPADAIYVCQDIAPRIADELSRETGAKVARVSRRFRNPANAPEPWQIEVLEQLAESGSTGEYPSEYCCEAENNIRYMKAIHVDPLCLSCHGTTLDRTVAEAIDTAYPHDRARGYSVGDLRGAFSVTWPDETAGR